MQLRDEPRPQCAIGCAVIIHQTYLHETRTAGVIPQSRSCNSPYSTGLRGFAIVRASVQCRFVIDGTSNTIAIGEVLVNQHDHIGRQLVVLQCGASHATTIIPINYKISSQWAGGCGDIQTNNWNCRGLQIETPGDELRLWRGSVRMLTRPLTRHLPETGLS